jgi:hypothetical protein
MMPDEMPDNLAELDEMIGADMAAAARRAADDAETYRRDREAYTAEHGTADPDSFEPWSAVSKPGEVSRGPYC